MLAAEKVWSSRAHTDPLVCLLLSCVFGWESLSSYGGQFPQVPAQDPSLWGLTTIGACEPKNNQAQSLGFCWGEVPITVLRAKEVSKLPQTRNVIN